MVFLEPLAGVPSGWLLSLKWPQAFPAEDESTRDASAWPSWGSGTQSAVTGQERVLRREAGELLRQLWRLGGAQTPQKSTLHHGEEREALMDLPSRSRLCPWPKRDSPSPPPPDSMTRFLGSLRARLMLLHPSPNCSLRAESLVHVHFKEEIGIAELIPLVTTYIILFAYIYFSTRGSTAQGLGAFSKLSAHSRPPAPHLWKWLGQRCRTCPVLAKARASSSRTVSGLGGSRPSWASREKTLPGLGFLKDTPFP